MRVLGIGFAIVTGLIILVGYFIPALEPIQNLLLGWVIILAGTATVVGIFNLILVHANRISNREKGAIYSAVLLVCLFASFLFGLALGPDDPSMRRLLDAVVLPVESSLMALLAVTLLYAGVRLLRHRASLMTLTFLATAILMIFTSATLPFGEVGPLNHFLRPWLQYVPALAGARGILIGVGLGAMVTGLRILIGADRPYDTK